MSVSLELTGGRTVRLAENVADRLSAAVIVADEATVREEPEVWERTAMLAQRLRMLHRGRRPAEIAGLREARALYKAFGMDPTRHRPSSEALLRRVLKGKDIYHINNVVDCGNLASLSFLLPLGLYDLDLVGGDIELRVGSMGDEYPGIRKGPVHLEGRLTLADDAGPFGSPTSDSARTAVSETTRRLLAIIMATAGYPAARLDAHAVQLGDLFATYCGARITRRGLLSAGATA